MTPRGSLPSWLQLESNILDSLRVSSQGQTFDPPNQSLDDTSLEACLLDPWQESSIGSLDDTSLESTHLTPPGVLTCMTLVGSHLGQMLNPPKEFRGNHIRVYHLRLLQESIILGPKREFRWHHIKGYPLHFIGVYPFDPSRSLTCMTLVGNHLGQMLNPQKHKLVDCFYR